MDSLTDDPDNVNNADAQRKLHDLLESMWQQRKSAVLERLHTLQSVVLNLSSLPTAKSRAVGIDAAHKLAGILGTFGIPRGTDLARETEVCLSQEKPLTSPEIEHLQTVASEIASLIAQRSLPTSI